MSILVLFMAAAIAYAMGFTFEISAFLLLGVVFEAALWVVLFLTLKNRKYSVR